MEKQVEVRINKGLDILKKLSDSVDIVKEMIVIADNKKINPNDLLKKMRELKENIEKIKKIKGKDEVLLKDCGLLFDGFEKAMIMYALIIRKAVEIGAFPMQKETRDFAEAIMELFTLMALDTSAELAKVIATLEPKDQLDALISLRKCAM